MSSWLQSALLASCVWCLLSATASAVPSYLLLQRSPQSASRYPQPTRHPAAPSPYRGYGHIVTQPTYSYGWFGAPPRRHGYKHNGFYRNYTQWTWK